MIFFPALNFITGVLILTAGFLAYRNNRRSKRNFVFFFLTINAFIWQIGTGIVSVSQTPFLAEAGTRIAFLGISLIPISSYHLSTKIKETRARKMLILGYCLAMFFFMPLGWTPLMFDGVHIYSWGFFFRAGMLHPLFLLFFIVYMSLSFMNLFGAYQTEKNILEKNRKKYFLIALILAYAGSIDYLPTYGVGVYPLGFLSLIFFVAIFAYAIIRYHLMDINLVLTRAGLFTFVYLFVLGVPFVLGYRYGLWYFSTWIMLPLATIGPFIYTYLQRRTENLLRDQRMYQNAIRKLSRTMTRIRDTDELLAIVGTTIADTVRTSHLSIYLRDDEYASYRNKFSFPSGGVSHFKELLPVDHPVVGVMLKYRRPMLFEEAGNVLSREELNCTLIVPCFMEGNLLAFMLLGSKNGNRIYTPEDLLAFETLSYSTALSIENCFFWKEIEDRQRKARLQEMDAFSYSLAHEIDNPMSIIIGNSDLLKMLLQKSGLTEIKKNDMIKYLYYIRESAQRVSAMVKAIYDFGQKRSGEYYLLNINKVVDSFLQLYMPEFKQNKIRITKEIPDQPITVYGEKHELMNVLVNFAKNSVHALQGTDDKEIKIKIDRINSDLVRITFADNGYGIPAEKIPIVFAPFVTTKASSEGTGMGLYLVKRTIDRHGGKIRIESEGENKGTSIILELPISKNTVSEDIDRKNIAKGKRRF